jgi:hypothetical protein
MAVAPLDTSGGHQVRLHLSNSTVAQLIDYQSRFVGLGRHKPNYSTLLEATVTCSTRHSFDDLVAAVESQP